MDRALAGVWTRFNGDCGEFAPRPGWLFHCKDFFVLGRRRKGLTCSAVSSLMHNAICAVGFAGPAKLTPDEFIRKWKTAELKERAAAQSHFIDLCRMLDEPAPTDADPKGEWYAFERGATKTTGGEGWADVWKRDHFGWEYKGKRKDLTLRSPNFNSTPGAGKPSAAGRLRYGSVSNPYQLDEQRFGSSQIQP